MDGYGAEITPLLNRISPASPVRIAVDRVLRRESLSEDQIETLIAVAGNPDDAKWRERSASIWALGHTDCGDARERAAKLLIRALDGHEATGLRYFARWLQPVFVFGALALSALALVAFALAIHNRSSSEEVVFAMLTGSAAIITISTSAVLFVVGRGNRLRVRAIAARSLGGLLIAGAIPELAIAAIEPDYEVRANARWALLRILPSLTSDHYGRLNGATVPALCSLLSGLDGIPDQDDPLEAEVLRALGKVGDGRAVQQVEWVADNFAGTDAHRGLARSILPVLHARAKFERDPALLLRGSMAPDERLLRPACGSGPDQDEALRRSASSALAKNSTEVGP